MTIKKLITLSTATAIAFGVISASIADTALEARKIIEANQNAVVTVELVIEASAQGQSEKHEGKTSATGTIIDPSGLVVTSVTAINPIDRFANDEYKISTKIVDAKIRLADGTEIPANLVLQDRDLDIAFIKPKKALSEPLSFVDMNQQSAPQALEELLLLARLGKVGNRAIGADVQRVAAVVNKPRLFYVITGSAVPGFGVPTFSMDGKCVGITVLRSSHGKDSDSDMLSTDKLLYVLLPCSTIQKAAEQAKNATPPKVQDTPEPKAIKKASPKTK